MSAGEFKTSRYELDSGVIIPIKVQEETESLTFGGTANEPPAGPAVRDYGSARVGGGTREIGIRARNVTVKWVTTVPPGYKSSGLLRLPILTPALHGALASGNQGTYTLNGTSYDVEVVGVPGDEIRR
jgi:hypothetical protein